MNEAAEVPPPNEECVFGNWGHSEVCHRRQIVSLNNNKHLLKIRNNEKLSRVEIFELFFFIKDYLENVII